MEMSSIAIVAVIAAIFIIQLQFRLKKIEMKMIDLDMRIDSLEANRRESPSS